MHVHDAFINFVSMFYDTMVTDESVNMQLLATECPAETVTGLS